MFIHAGAYHWWPKIVEFRNDYCLSCGGPRRSVRIRTFDVGHLYWIPILPVGFWKHWQCTACQRNPHQSPKTRRSFKWVGLVVLVLFSVTFWAVPVAPDFVTGSWIFRVGGPVAGILVLWHLLRTPEDPSLKERLATVVPASETMCPFCGTPLIGGHHWSCPNCGVVRS
jgi:uncharacterized membrane protein (DUF485 family)